jgi:NADH dehydrogenase
VIVSVPPGFGYLVASVIGRLVRDRFLAREEIQGLLEDRLCTNSPPAGEVRLTDWVNENASVLGARYASELGRRRNRTDPYDTLS